MRYQWALLGVALFMGAVYVGMPMLGWIEDWQTRFVLLPVILFIAGAGVALFGANRPGRRS